jgi:hypothetical protein
MAKPGKVELLFQIEGADMDTLPIWAQITIGILSAGFIANLIAIISLIVGIRQKNRELKEAKLQRLNDNLLLNTRPHIDSLYIPINKLLASLELRYDEYKTALARCRGYNIKKGMEVSEDPPESQASVDLALFLSSKKYDATLAMTTICKDIINYQEKMIAEGTIAYLTKDFEKRFASFIRFLYAVNIVSHTYLLPLKEGPIEQPKVFILGEPEFEKELYGEIDYIRTYIRELALGTIETEIAIAQKSCNH